MAALGRNTPASLLKSLCYRGKYRLISPNIRAYTNQNEHDKYDVAIVGGGIIGLATARQMILSHPNLSYAVVEKENIMAAHQSGHNSGVIHAGIYYTPGSLKAKLCVRGLKESYKYFDKHNIPHQRCGKLIVATTPEEVSRLDGLYERGLQNEVPGLSLVDEKQIREIEPYCRGLRALHSSETGIVDWGEVTKSYGREFQQRGGVIHSGFKVTDFKESDDPEFPISVIGENSNTFFLKKCIKAKYVITCGGLYSDRLATKSGCNPVPRIIPFRGEYLLLNPEKRHLVKGNIYPLPDPRFPFLGVHFTPRVDGSVWLGPNAVLAFKREGYKLSNINPVDLLGDLSYSGLQKLVFRNLSYAFGELYRGVHIAAQVKQLQRFIPELKVEDVRRGPSGVRAMAVDEEGRLVDDFIFDSGDSLLGKRMLHVRNAPSPAATSSLAIAEMITEKVTTTFSL